jgi:polyferredoxin
MGSIIKEKLKRLSRLRLLTQFSTLLLLNFPFIHMQSVCAPVFYCHGCPLSAMACPIGVLVNFSTLRVFPLVTIGILGLVGTIGGRLVCGWLCPFGLLQDVLHKIPTPKISLPRALNYTKYLVLVGLVFAVPFFFPGKPYTFCHFCPSGTLEASIPWQIMGVGSGGGLWAHLIRYGVLAAVILLAVVTSRSWCRTLCPLGAIFSFFNRFSLYRFKLVTPKCNSCGVCARNCPVDIDPVKEMNTAECIRCMDCTHHKHIRLGTK